MLCTVYAFVEAISIHYLIFFFLSCLKAAFLVKIYIICDSTEKSPPNHIKQNEKKHFGTLKYLYLDAYCMNLYLDTYLCVGVCNQHL